MTITGLAHKITDSPVSSPVGELKDLASLSHRARYNTLLHIMPSTGDDAERKRLVAKTVAHLGQKLHRYGRQHVGTTVYEKSPEVDLHGHHICRVKPADQSILTKYDGYIVDVELIPPSKLPKRVAYITK